ncbi:MAG: hypothetical protein EOM28_07035 [Clostridia bacterium]|nr:hypothetical protein [Clostridia bacterium]
MDSDIAIGKACNVSTLKYGLIVPKGTYADIVAARTALAGTVIYYELATPVTIDEEDFADYGISIEGVLTSNNEYTEFYTGNYNIFSPISIEYAANLAKAVENLKGGMISLKEFQMMQNLINLEFDARIAVLEP